MHNNLYNTYNTEEHAKMLLNNAAQRKWGDRTRQYVTYEEICTGPQHAQMWYARALIAGVEYGRGSGTSKKAAVQEAASQALAIFLQQNPGCAS